MLRVLSYLKHVWPAAVLAPLLMALEVYMDLLSPRLMASIIDEGVVKGDLAHIQRTGFFMIGIALIGIVGGVGCGIFSSIASQKFGTQIRQELFDKIQTFSYRNLEQMTTGSLITRLTNDIMQVQMFVMMLLRMMVRAPLISIGSFIMAFLISPKLALILLLVIPILAIAIFFIMRKGILLFNQVQQKMDGVNTVLKENFAGIRVVKAFVRHIFENSRFRRANDQYMDISLQAAIVMATLMPVMMLLMNGSIVAVIWFGGLQTWEGSLQIGELAAFINYVMHVLFSLMMFSMMMVNITRAKASADRIVEVLDIESEIQNEEHAIVDSISGGRIEFENVSFIYANQERVLKNINFVAEPGQTIAILGATGSGKTTLVHLIPRLYEASKGRVLIDGVDVRKMDLYSLRSRIGIVLQQALLFSGTIEENIRYGRPNATHEQVVEAAKAAQAHEFITKLPEGYQTQLGQRGINLSGGQKQRISIARTLLIKPSILILDDSTSAIDLKTEAKLQQALKSLMKSSTNLIIAQRISSVTEADKILVLDEGEIIAEGTHESLLQESPVYQEIYQSQTERGDASYG